jgi:hypothetical protein
VGQTIRRFPFAQLLDDFTMGGMQQIRISCDDHSVHVGKRRFDCEWMEGSQMNRWLLRARLAEALAAHGPHSHRLETRLKSEAAQAITL